MKHNKQDDIATLGIRVLFIISAIRLLAYALELYYNDGAFWRWLDVGILLFLIVGTLYVEVAALICSRCNSIYLIIGYLLYGAFMGCEFIMVWNLIQVKDWITGLLCPTFIGLALVSGYNTVTKVLSGKHDDDDDDDLESVGNWDTAKAKLKEDSKDR